jgi:hypothetical protein
VDPVVQRDRGVDTPVDYMAMFRPDAPWRTVAGGLQAFMISTPFARRSTDEELTQLLADLRRRRIPLAMQAEISLGHDGCGFRVNGYTTGVMGITAARLKRFGADLRYVAMDAPLWFGHNYSGPYACRDSIAQIAKSVAIGVAQLRRWYPDVQIGDDEPISYKTLAVPDWLDQLREWMSAYQAATGTPLAFMYSDLVWQSNWLPTMRALRSELHSRGIKFGVIIDGDPHDPTDLVWTSRAVARYQTVMANPQIAPDYLRVHSWHARPTRLLPETEPGTLTNVALQILRR